MKIHPTPFRFVKNQPAIIRVLLVGLGLAALFGASAARADEFANITVDDSAEIGWLTLDHDLTIPDGILYIGTWWDGSGGWGTGSSWPGIRIEDDAGPDGGNGTIGLFYGYSNDMTWTWREGANSDPATQMTLDPGSNLTVIDPLSGNTLVLNPSESIIGNPGGSLLLGANTTLLLGGTQVTLDANGVLTLIDPISSNTIVLDPGNATVTVAGTVLGGAVTNDYYFDPTGFSLDATTGAIAQGHNTTSDGSNGTVTLGSNTVVSGAGAVALGLNSTAAGLGSVALGGYSTVTGNGTAALGSNLTVTADHALVAGQYNAAITGSGGTTLLFALGNGSGSGNLSNAVTVLKNGNTTVAGAFSLGGNATLNGAENTVSGNTTFSGSGNVTTFNGDAAVGGNITVTGNTTLNGTVILSQRQGDVYMGIFTSVSGDQAP